MEVKHGDSSEWTLGICREDVKRTDWYKSPQIRGSGLWGDMTMDIVPGLNLILCYTVGRFPIRWEFSWTPVKGMSPSIT